jgi:hypothetical protein
LLRSHHCATFVDSIFIESGTFFSRVAYQERRYFAFDEVDVEIVPNHRELWLLGHFTSLPIFYIFHHRLAVHAQNSSAAVDRSIGTVEIVDATTIIDPVYDIDRKIVDAKEPKNERTAGRPCIPSHDLTTLRVFSIKVFERRIHLTSA